MFQSVAGICRPKVWHLSLSTTLLAKIPLCLCTYKARNTVFLYYFLAMDFSYVTHCAPVPRPLVLLLHVIDIVSYCVSAIFYFLGLHPSFQMAPSPWEDRVIVMEVTQHSPIAPSLVKSRLQVLEYQQIARNSDQYQPICTVCLTGFRLDDEVRELGNCCHAFHKECIDQWIDIGKVTCPLCRLDMLPAKGKRRMEKIVCSIEKFWRILIKYFS